MQATEISKRKYFTKAQKRSILDELNSNGMTISVLARKHDIHPVTVHKWKREMGTIKKDESSIDISKLLEELEKSKQENENLKKALADVAVEKQILQTANEILKKKQIQQQLNSQKKQSKK